MIHPSPSNKHRAIRSFVLRNKRMTLGQKMAIESFLPIYTIDFDNKIVDLNAIFGRIAPKILEIGSGMGNSLIQIANKNRDNDYLAVEVHRPGIASLVRQIEKNKLTNIRIITHDIVDILEYQLAANSIDHVYIFFPDPWPKKKHHKRRLINASLLSLVKNTLKDHGCLFIATDWQNYAEQIIELITAQTDVINLAGHNQYSFHPKWRPITKFEQRAINSGHHIYDIALAFRH